MTIQDLHMAVKIELDKNVISSYPDFTDEQIDYFINRAYLMLINQKFTGHNELQTGFEGNKKRIADLNNLIISSDLTDNTVIGNEFRFEPTASNMLYPVNQTITFNLSVSGGQEKRTVIDVNHEIINRFILTETNNPWIPEPAMAWEQGIARVFVDPIDLVRYTENAELHVRYIKRPTRLQSYIYVGGNRVPNLSGDDTQIPEVSEHVHFEIVSLTVDLMLDNIESQRIQTHPQLTQIKE